ncbi:MAG: DMT family transporter [Baekduia sp.]
MSARALVLFGLAAALWGVSYLFMKVALEDGISEGVILCLRTAFGAAVLIPIAVRQGALASPRKALRPWVLAFALSQALIPFALIVLAENWIASGLTGILIAAAPIFLALIAPFVDPEERSSGLALVGVGVGMAGVVVLFLADLGSLGGMAIVGGLLVLGAAAVYGFAPLIFKLRIAPDPHVGALAVTMALSAIVYLPWALATLPGGDVSAWSWLAIVGLGAGGTGVAFYAFYEVVDEVGPARASLVAYVAPLFSVLYGVLLLSEPFTAGTAVGMVLILGGSWLAARRSPDAEGNPPVD